MRGARGSEVALPATRITKGGKAGSGSKGSAKKKQPEAGPPAFGWKPSISRSDRLLRGGQEQPFSLLDRRVHRRRQGLGVNGLIVVEAAAQHQGRGEDGQGQNRAH
jgi:hypothetical protein